MKGVGMSHLEKSKEFFRWLEARLPLSMDKRSIFFFILKLSRDGWGLHGMSLANRF